MLNNSKVGITIKISKQRTNIYLFFWSIDPFSQHHSMNCEEDWLSVSELWQSVALVHIEAHSIGHMIGFHAKHSGNSFHLLGTRVSVALTQSEWQKSVPKTEEGTIMMLWNDISMAHAQRLHTIQSNQWFVENDEEKKTQLASHEMSFTFFFFFQVHRFFGEK